MFKKHILTNWLYECQKKWWDLQGKQNKYNNESKDNP